MFELPEELRQLEQMRCERQEWAADYYPVTEQGLLARFNPRTSQSPSQNLPAANTQPGSFEPATVESSTEADPLLHQAPTSPSRVNDVSSAQSVDDPTAQDSVPATVSDLRKRISVSPLSLGVGRGRSEILMETLGRGTSFGKEKSSIQALPAIGRGFLLQIPQAQIPRQSAGDIKTPSKMEVAPSCPILKPSQEGMPQPQTSATDLPKDTLSLRGGNSSQTSQSLSSSLRESFRSFRY